MRVEHRSQKHDWETPDDLLVRVRNVFGGVIACDPATSPENPTRALQFFTEEDNGLDKSWSNHWFCNPPYGKSLGVWSYKIAAEAEYVEGIALVPSRTDTKWFRTMFEHADGVCFLHGRLKFKGAKDPAPFPSALFYFGYSVRRFNEAFEDIGLLVAGGGGR